MARTMTVDSTDVYRALVTYRYGFDLNEKQFQVAFGPYSSKAHVQDYDASYRNGPTRVEKQVLVHSYREPDWNVEPGVYWETIDTKYTNGGEDVEWDD